MHCVDYFTKHDIKVIAYCNFPGFLRNILVIKENTKCVGTCVKNIGGRLKRTGGKGEKVLRKSSRERVSWIILIKS